MTGMVESTSTVLGSRVLALLAGDTAVEGCDGEAFAVCNDVEALPHSVDREAVMRKARFGQK